MEKLLSLLDKLLDSALGELYEKDHYLLEHDVHERTIVFRLGHYLQNLMDATGEFQNFNLDFEYNRNGRYPKRIPANPYSLISYLLGKMALSHSMLESVCLSSAPAHHNPTPLYLDVAHPHLHNRPI